MELLDYIKGLRSGRKAHYIEREAMNDPFLQEALEGYESIAGNHAKQIERLKTRTIKRVKPLKIANLNIQNWSIAATILLCISIGIVGYLLVNEQNTMRLENMQAEVREQSIPKEEIPEMSSQNENKSQEIIQTSPKELIAAFTPPVIIADEEADESALSFSTEDNFGIIESDEVVAESAEIIKSEYPKSESVAMIDLPLKTQADAEPEAVVVIVEADKVSDSRTSDKLITGKVVDADGESLPGVSIQIAGTNQETVTDIDGKFNLRSVVDSQLVLNYIGFETLKIPADTGNMLIAMTESTMELSEVVAGRSSRSRKESTITKQETPVPVTGMNEYRKYLRENAASSKDKQCRGIVEVRFYVDENGRPKDIIVSKNLCKTADNEAIRLINEGCNWTIGSQQVVIEVRFR